MNAPGLTVRETSETHNGVARGAYDGTTRAGAMKALLELHQDPEPAPERRPLMERILGRRSLVEWLIG